jgi:hypothetical protein
MTSPTPEEPGRVVPPPDPAKRPWTTPRLVIHGKLPKLTFGANSPKTQE